MHKHSHIYKSSLNTVSIKAMVCVMVALYISDSSFNIDIILVKEMQDPCYVGVDLNCPMHMTISPGSHSP